jgi:hypothetical protein
MKGLHKSTKGEFPHNISCNELSKMFEPINTNIIYSGDRTTNIIVFEILFGNYIREEQYDIYFDIIDGIDDCKNSMTNTKCHNNGYSVYQLLMGRGKTSVITPLILFNYVFNNNFKNIILLLPESLVLQTLNYINTNYSFILDLNINDINSIKRFDSNQTFNSNQTKNEKLELIKNDNILCRNIILVDDKTIKTIFLNNMIVKDINLLENIKNSLIIVDEFDSMYDPMKSNFNYPLTSTTVDKEEIFEKNFYFFLIDFITFIIKNKKEKEDINLTLVEFYNSGHELYRDLLINHAIKLAKILNTIQSCFNLKFNFNYGFPSDESHSDMYMAVPYNGVDNPVSGSKFSEIDINIILTILSYQYNIIYRKIDVDNNIKTLITSTSEYLNVLNSTEINKMFNKEFTFYGINLYDSFWSWASNKIK